MERVGQGPAGETVAGKIFKIGFIGCYHYRVTLRESSGNAQKNYGYERRQ
jgi:hypothetical protein